MDIGIDYPFSQLPAEDIERFPYAVLEVKLQTAAGQDPPQWIRELIASHLVEAVPKFSKFIHGTATMFPSRINLLPFWMPQMGIDIRKPITHRFGIERPANTASFSTSDDAMDDDSDDEREEYSAGQRTLPVDGDENLNRLRDARDALQQHGRDREAHEAGQDEPHAAQNELDIEERVAAQPLDEDPNDYPLYDSEEENEEDEMEEARRKGGLAYGWKLAKKHVAVAGDYITTGIPQFVPTPTPTDIPSNGNIGGMNPMRGQVEARKFKAPKGKRIHVPVRVEPKVYFANERTFLSWLEFSIILGSIAATLLNFGDDVSLISAWGFTVVASIALLYSVGIYYLRVEMIRKRRANVARYYDKYGPTFLCLGLLAATVVNFVFKIKEDGWFQNSAQSVTGKALFGAAGSGEL